MPNDNYTFAFDPVWDELGDILEIIAILKSIEEEKDFIDAQARRANPWDVAVNLHQILLEASRMQTDLRKIRAHLDRLYGVTEKRIYQQKQQAQETSQAQEHRILEVVERRLLEYRSEQLEYQTGQGLETEMGNGSKNGRGAKLPKPKKTARPRPRPKYRGNR